MSLPTYIANFIRSHKIERSRMEYSGDWNPEQILHTICAFANDNPTQSDGYIIIDISGSKESSSLLADGLKQATIDRIYKELLQICNLIEPHYIPAVEQVAWEDKTLILLQISSGADRPYKCPVSFSDKECKKLYYIRKMSDNIPINAIEATGKMRSRRNIPQIKELVLSVLEEKGDLPTSELAMQLNYTKVTAALSKAIKELMEEGKLVYSDPMHRHSPTQRLHLVKKDDK